jgi:hypothetical protein
MKKNTLLKSVAKIRLLCYICADYAKTVFFSPEKVTREGCRMTERGKKVK